MSARKSKVVKVNISAGTYKDEAEAVREANAIKRWLIRYCDKNGYSIKGKVWISTNSAYAGRIINKGRKKEYKPNGKPLPTVVEAHIHMVLFCNPASTIVDALKSYLNKKHMKAVVWDRHCNSRAEVENAVEYAMRQSRKVRTIDYDRKDVLSVDEWGYYEAVERAEAKIKDNMAFTESEPEQTPETLENKSVSSISDTPETLTYKSIKYNYIYYYVVPISYNHSIIKALLQDIIYYGRESSRSSCSKIIFKKVLLKVPHLLKNVKFCVIILVLIILRCFFMNIKDFIANFRNHPVLFIGTGISLRYLNNSYTWDNLLKHISFEMTGDCEHYLDIKSNHYKNSTYAYDEIATDLEKEFNSYLQTPEQRNGKFKNVNDYFYENMERNINISRFKIYVSNLFKDISVKEEKQEELAILKKARKNIGSIITTNYDEFIETFFDFKPLIGNDILLSNPYGSVYKIHGCITEPRKIIITSEDYNVFANKYELIRAQLLSLFIHNPIVFLGYNIGDSNIKDLLRTIFTYVNPNTPEADKIRSNFLLVEYEEGSTNTEVAEHDIVLEDIATIRINKIKTDDFVSIYEAIGSLQLPVSAMDIRKVQNIVKEIYSGGDIKVSITEDLDKLDNKDKVLVIGSSNTVTYVYQTTKEMMINYFSIIEEENARLIELINKQKIQTSQFFPIFAFSKITPNIEKVDEIKKIQTDKLKGITKVITKHTTIERIVNDESISKTNKHYAIVTALLNNQLDLCDVEKYLKDYRDKLSTDYRRLLCAYDYMKYGD